MKAPKTNLGTKWFVSVGTALACGGTVFAAAIDQTLFSGASGPMRDDYSGMVGLVFQVGESDREVTHLGFWDNGKDGLQLAHRVGIYEATAPWTGTGNLLASVTVGPGTDDLLNTDYRWAELSTPFTLQAWGWYVLAGEVFANSGDAWENSSALVWNPWVIGSNPNSTRASRYSGTPWPHEPEGQWGDGGWAYGAVNLAVIPEPSTLALSCLAVLALFARRRVG